MKTVDFEVFLKFSTTSTSLKGEAVTLAILAAIFIKKFAAAKSGREGTFFKLLNKRLSTYKTDFLGKTVVSEQIERDKCNPQKI